jgi:hypothetical protein
MFAILAAALGFVETAASSCDIDPSAYLTQDYDTFDQSDAGWRSIAQQGCYAQAAGLIEAYRQSRGDALEPADAWTLVWHLAQMHAYAGDYPAAISAYEATRQINAPHRVNTELKTDAVIAFLTRDMETLQSVRDQLLAIPEPEGFQDMVRRAMERFPDADPPSWPPELARVEQYIRCFDYPYAIAYEDAC